jgi:hypothetical protein
MARWLWEPGGLDLARFTRGIWKRRWLVAGIALRLLHTGYKIRS